MRTFMVGFSVWNPLARVHTLRVTFADTLRNWRSVARVLAQRRGHFEARCGWVTLVRTMVGSVLGRSTLLGIVLAALSLGRAVAAMDASVMPHRGQPGEHAALTTI